MMQTSRPFGHFGDGDNPQGNKIGNYAKGLAIAWTLLIGSSFGWAYYHGISEIEEFARAEVGVRDIRSGNNSIPLSTFKEVVHNNLKGLAMGHALILALGLGMIRIGGDRLSDGAREQKRIEDELHLQTVQLEEEIAERQMAQESLQESEAHLRIVAKQLEKEATERETAREELERLNYSLEERIGKAVVELRLKDQTMIQQSRLAALGEMINNIAHQWRQPLNNIGLIIQNVQYSFDSGTITSEEMQGDIRKAMDIIMHMSRTIDDFRNFFRNDKEKQRFSINKAVNRTLEFVSAALEQRDIKVTIEAAGDVTAIGLQNEYSQVLLNIISNVSETSIERRVSEPHIFIRITLENGRSVMYMRDNCGGIADNIIPRIFDPYFTTRSPDKGTGIGLYISKVIIEQNMGGSLTARNVEGGAEFRIEV